jgi:hypothetical protein
MKDKFPDNKKYGWDSLSVFISAIGVMALIFVSHGILIAITLMLTAFWRIRSEEIFKREKEEIIFLSFVKNIRKLSIEVTNNWIFNKITGFLYEWRDRHRSKVAGSIIICPRCKKKIKLKNQNNQSIIWCPKCFARLRRKNTNKVIYIKKDW